MRLGIIGDIHADVRALEAVFRHLEGLDVDRLVCTGDLVGYGWQADQVVALVRDRQIPCIRGNHDRWALEKRQVIGPRGWKPAVFHDATWEYLQNLPTSRLLHEPEVLIEIHHGSPESDMEFVTPYKPLPQSVENHLERCEARVLLLGHTHIAMIERRPGKLIVNPGSVLGVSGVQTSYSFGVLDLDDLSVFIHDVRTGREIRRDPLFQPIEEAAP